MELSNEQIILGIATTISAFLFGKTGIFQKIVDYLIGKFKTKDEKEQTELENRARQIVELKIQVDELKFVINKLNLDLIKTTTYVKTLLSYLLTAMPEGNKEFVEELAKEIRNNQ